MNSNESPLIPPTSAPLTVGSSSNPVMPQALDPQVVAMAKAIAQNESNTNYNDKGKSGEFGAYQWMPATWKADSQKYLGQNVPFGQATPQQQNQVAYRKIAAWKAAGYGPAQIASMWNSGDSDAYKGTFANGKPSRSSAPDGQPNAEGVNYDVPAYAKAVTDTYQKFISQQAQSPLVPPSSQPLTVTMPSGTNTPNPNTPAQSTGQKIGSGVIQGLGQAGQAGLGALKSIANTANTVSGWGQGLMSKLIPGGVATASLPKNVTTATNPDQQAGYLGGQIGQFFAPGGAESAITDSVSTLPKLAQLGIRGTASGLINTGLAKAQGQGNTASGIIGGVSALSPFAGELLGKVMPAVKDFFGGSGTADALKVKNATPKLVEAWSNGSRTVNDLADTITQAAENYNTQGIEKLQAVKDALPDIGIPPTNTQGGIQKIIDSASGNNLTVEEERTLQDRKSVV